MTTNDQLERSLSAHMAELGRLDATNLIADVVDRSTGAPQRSAWRQTTWWLSHWPGFADTPPMLLGPRRAYVLLALLFAALLAVVAGQALAPRPAPFTIRATYEGDLRAGRIATRRRPVRHPLGAARWPCPGAGSYGAPCGLDPRPRDRAARTDRAVGRVALVPGHIPAHGRPDADPGWRHHAGPVRGNLRECRSVHGRGVRPGGGHVLEPRPDGHSSLARGHDCPQGRPRLRHRRSRRASARNHADRVNRVLRSFDLDLRGRASDDGSPKRPLDGDALGRSRADRRRHLARRGQQS